MPKVSVIVPVYGVEKYIERCARSLFEQTLDDIEYIFVDDCTPDRSMEILDAIIEKYRLRLAAEKKAVRIERMPTNSGQAAVRRHGVQLATGDYIIHCDSDDWVEVDAYKRLYDKAIEDGADLIICDYYTSDGLTRKVHHGQMNESMSNVMFELINLWTHMVKRTLYNPEFIYPTSSMFEDRLFCAQLGYYATKISFLNEPLYYYYSNPSSICRVFTEEKCFSRYAQAKDNADKIIKFLEDKNIADLYPTEIVRLKYIARHQLAPITDRKKYYKIWLKCYPEITLKMLYIKGIKFSERLRFFITLIGVFSYFRSAK